MDAKNLRGPAAGQASATFTPTVLAVDASAALLQTLCAVFQTTPYLCVTADNTINALCAVVEHNPEVILVDADSGPLATWQFCMLLKSHAQYCDIRLIVTCGRNDLAEQARACACGADFFLAKPFTAEEVLALLTSRFESAA